jgi:hypothetical protein
LDASTRFFWTRISKMSFDHISGYQTLRSSYFVGSNATEIYKPSKQ